MHTPHIDFISLQKSLMFLYVHELKNYCEKLSLTTKGKKIILAARIMHFLKTQEKNSITPYPKSSLAKKNNLQQPALHALMLKGAYKNDLQNRLFFKSIIGNHFHFTAFGIDWLEEQWLSGTPPTYEQFIHMWKNEYAFRSIYKVAPKQEWAYINFIQTYSNMHPHACKDDIIHHWNIERTKHKKLVDQLIQTIITTKNQS